MDRDSSTNHGADNKPGSDYSALLPQPFRFKPIVGIAPHHYLLLLFGLLTLLVCAAFGYAVIRFQDSWLTVDSLPTGAQVYWNDELLGHTPLKKKIAPSSGVIRLEKHFFSAKEQEVAINNSWLPVPLWSAVPELNFQLSVKEGNSYNLLRYYWQDYVYRSLESEQLSTFGRSYALPPLLQRAVRDLVYAEGSEIPAEVLTKLVTELLAVTTSREQLADLLSAALISRSGKKLFSPWQLVNLGNELAQLVARTAVGEITNWSDDLLPSNWGAVLQRLSDHRAAKIGQPIAGGSDLSTSVVVNGVDFLLVDSAIPFYIQGSEVSQRQFAEFVASNPEWGAARQTEQDLSSFFPAGWGGQEPAQPPWLQYGELLQNSNYLSSWQNGRPAAILLDYPQANIDFAAVAAYLSWLNDNIPADFTGWQFALPTVEQWHLAYQKLSLARQSSPPDFNFPAKIDFAAVSDGLLVGMDGGLSEWSAEQYRVYNFVTAAAELQQLLQWLYPPLRLVQGANWLTNEDSVERKRLLIRNFDLPADQLENLVAAFPATLSNPFIGFRVVLQKNNTLLPQGEVVE